MSAIEAALENSRVTFVTHRGKCAHCKKYTYTTKTLPNLCYQGTLMFKELLKISEAYKKNEQRKISENKRRVTRKIEKEATP